MATPALVHDLRFHVGLPCHRRMCRTISLKRSPANIRTQLRNESAGTPAVSRHPTVAMPHSKRQHRLVPVRACPAGVSARTRVFLDKSSVNAGQRSVNARSTLGQRWPPKTLLPGGFVLRMVIKQCAANTKPFLMNLFIFYLIALCAASCATQTCPVEAFWGASVDRALTDRWPSVDRL